MSKMKKTSEGEPQTATSTEFYTKHVIVLDDAGDGPSRPVGMTVRPQWPPASGHHAALSSNAIQADCWAIALGPMLTPAEGMLLALLSDEERVRADRFLNEASRARYVSRHAALRLVLARYLDAAPASFCFVDEPDGRPVLARPAGRLHFSISHSGELALVAVSSVAPAGVDVEAIRTISDLTEMAEHYFTSAERESFLGLPSDELIAGFFTTWTRKEAFVKAIGRGLSFPLDLFCTGRSDAPAVLRVHDTRSEDWSIADLCPCEGYTGALAIGYPKAAPRLFSADWEWLLTG
jgi:4'-phosphopantetheinyl transferase